MCGIAGLWVFGGSQEARLRADVRAMCDRMQHRGPDGYGEWLDLQAGVALGHRRLAIIDLSPTGIQPMNSADQRFVITYNGELYNRQEIATELDMTFRGTSDTEVLVEAISRFGVDGALQRANGLFAFAVFDRATQILHLVRDRLGIKPLYWSRQQNAFAFASELKPLRAVSRFSFTLDPGALGSYLRHSCVPAPRAIFREVNKLLPGERIEVTPQDVRHHVYWDLPAIAGSRQADLTSASFDDVVNELDILLADAVKRQMVSDVPLGAFLSGGIDSSLVVALMCKTSNSRVKTFSIGFREEAYNEADHARRVAEQLGSEHTELILSAAEAQAVVPKLPAIYDEPFADSSQIPTCLVSRLARTHVTVALSGDGGDEAFGGYVRYRGINGLWTALRHVPRGFRRLGAHAIQWISPDAWDALAPALPRRIRPTHFGDKVLKGARLLDADSPLEMYRRLISQWPDPERLLSEYAEGYGWVERLSTCTEGFELQSRLRLLDMMSYLPDDILTKVDRASMAVSLEARVPLLDHRVVEYSWGLPNDYLFANGVGKRALRTVLKRYLPEYLFDRPKMGFGVPIGEWLSGPLRQWAEELLDPRALREGGVFDVGLLRQRWDEHCSGRRNWQHALWNVLQFQAWRAANL